MESRLTLIEVVDVLEEGGPDLPADPFALIMWENIGYLIDDQRRRRLFDDFDRTIGLDPAAIAAADEAVLLDLARHGGMRPENRVRRWREIARIVQGRCAGELSGALRALPLAKARALLRTFPMIGDPGADKVLLFSDIAPRPCLESNGLRALARLGFFREQASYDASYKAAITVLVEQGRAAAPWLRRAFLTLRELGKDPCKRGLPHCAACALDAVCAHAEVSAL